MATKQSTIDYLLDQLTSAGEIRAQKMFGEYGVYYDNKIVALVCDDQLFVKITPIGHDFLDSSYEAPPYPGAKNYLCVPEERWEDREWLVDFIRQTAQVLPQPKLKRKH